MSSLKILVLLFVSYLMIHVSQSKSIACKLNVSIKQQAGTLGASVPSTLDAALTTTINLGVLKDPLGTSPVYVVIIDTGIADLWVRDQTCRDSFCVSRTDPLPYDRLTRASFYDLGKSATVSSLEKRYEARGITTLEQMTLLATPPQVVYNQEFIRVTSTKGLTTANAFDGFMGLANRVTTRSSLNAESLIQRMVNQGVIDRRTFTISAAATTLTFGDVPTLTAPINYVNVVTRGVWNFRANSVTLDNGLRSFNVQTGPTIRIESILSNIGIPSAPLGRLAGDLRATLNPQTKQYDISCAELTATPPKNLLLTINGQIYTIPPTSYINAAVGTGPCTLNILVTREWMLGQTFLKLFDVVFDAQSNTNQIGFSIPPPTPTP